MGDKIDTSRDGASRSAILDSILALLDERDMLRAALASSQRALVAALDNRFSPAVTQLFTDEAKIADAMRDAGPSLEAMVQHMHGDGGHV